MKISENLERKIRYYCSRFPSTEWSGILFFKLEGTFKKDGLTIYADDMLLMDIGDTTTTGFSLSPDVIHYMAINDIVTHQIGLIHSHHSMAKLNC